MRGMFESATWPLRKLAWLIEEKVLWPLADVLRKWSGRSFAHLRVEPVAEPLDEVGPQPLETATAQPLEGAVGTVDRRIFPRMRDRLRNRLGTSGRDVFVVLGTIAVALGVGIGVVAITGPHNSTPTAPSVPAGNASAPVAPPTSPATNTPPNADRSTLQGVSPDFNASTKAAGSSAVPTAGAQASPLKGANSKPSSIPPGVANDVAALHAARDFAGAFVLYEVGKSNPQVKKTFARTATPALAKALRDRPPRLPSSAQVPTAKVQNVVLGAKHGPKLDASVSLLRLGAVSELRLTLIQRHKAWIVNEVRG
jgi:hypothetical protein